MEGGDFKRLLLAFRLASILTRDPSPDSSENPFYFSLKIKRCNV
jgi:hypothetical protein